VLEELNDLVMRRYGESRRQLFERIDRPALRPLPPTRLVIGQWRNAGVNVDYDVYIEGPAPSGRSTIAAFTMARIGIITPHAST